MKRVLSLMLIVVLTGLTLGVSPAYDSATVVLENDFGIAASGSVKAFLFNEEGELLLTIASAQPLFSFPLNEIRKAQKVESSNYALRVISNGQIGVLWFSDNEVLHGQNELRINMQLDPTVSSKRMGEIMSEGFIILEDTYPWGNYFTTVGEIHACSKMYSTVEFASNSEIGVEVKKRWASGGSWFDIGYAYKSINGSVYTTPMHTNPMDSSTQGGREIKREYAYIMQVWAQYDGNGELVTRWEELKASHLIGGLAWGDYVPGDRAPYNDVMAGFYGTRESMMGGSSLSRTYNSSHNYDVAVKIGSIDIGARTSYKTGTKTNFTFHTYGNPSDMHPNYAFYSRAGTINNPIWPRTFFTHN